MDVSGSGEAVDAPGCDTPGGTLGNHLLPVSELLAAGARVVALGAGRC
jgi:hypothetical protein